MHPSAYPSSIHPRKEISSKRINHELLGDTFHYVFIHERKANQYCRTSPQLPACTHFRLLPPLPTPQQTPPASCSFHLQQTCLILICLQVWFPLPRRVILSQSREFCAPFTQFSPDTTTSRKTSLTSSCPLSLLFTFYKVYSPSVVVLTDKPPQMKES